jgi:hypothetical protein
MKIVQLASFLNAFVDSSDRMLSAHNEMLLRVERARSQAVLRPGDDKSRVVGREREKEERHVLREKEKEKGRERQREGTSVKSNGSKCSEERESDSRTAVKRRDKDKEREKDKDRVEDSHIPALRSDIEYELERNDSPVAHPHSKSTSVSAAGVTYTGSGVGVGVGAGTGAGGAEGTAWLSKEALDNLNTEYSDSDSLLSAFSHATKTKRKGLNKKKAGVISGDIKPNMSGISLSLLKENAGDSERVIEIDNDSEDSNKNIKSKSENKSENKSVNKDKGESESKSKNDAVEDQEEVSLCSDDSFESALEEPIPALAPAHDAALSSSSSSGPNPNPSHSHTRSHSDGGGRVRGEGDDGSVEEEEDESDGDDSEGESEGDDEGGSDSESGSESGTSDDATEEAEKFNELIRETESLRSQLMSNIRLVESDKSKADVLHMLQLELSGCEDSLRALKIAYIESLMLANTADIDHENGRGRSKEDEEAAEGTYLLNFFPYFVLFFCLWIIKFD